MTPFTRICAHPLLTDVTPIWPWPGGGWSLIYDDGHSFIFNMALDLLEIATIEDLATGINDRRFASAAKIAFSTGDTDRFLNEFLLKANQRLPIADASISARDAIWRNRCVAGLFSIDSLIEFKFRDRKSETHDTFRIANRP